MVNGVSASNTAQPAYNNNPSRNSPADIRAYLDFQLLLSRVITGQQPVAGEDTAAEPPTEIQDTAPALIRSDSGFKQFITQHQLDLGTRLHAKPHNVDRLTLMLLADAFSAGSQIAPEEAALPYPLTLA
jgi:hypothetical protein